MKQRNVISEIQRLLGNKNFGKADLFALIQHIKKPAYQACNLFEIISFDNTETSQKKYKTLLEMAQVDVGTTDRLGFSIVNKFIFACYLNNIELAREEEMVEHLAFVKRAFISCLSEEELEKYLSDVVEAASKDETGVDILSFGLNTPFCHIMNTADMLYFQKAIAEELQIPETLFIVETTTIKECIASLKEQISIYSQNKTNKAMITKTTWPEPFNTMNAAARKNALIELFRRQANVVLFAYSTGVEDHELQVEVDYTIDEINDVTVKLNTMGLDERKLEEVSKNIGKELGAPVLISDINMSIDAYIEVVESYFE